MAKWELRPNDETMLEEYKKGNVKLSHGGMNMDCGNGLILFYEFPEWLNLFIEDISEKAYTNGQNNIIENW
jgi:hypothetical protein